MSLLTSREVLLIKTEGTYNVDANPTAASDAVLVENLAWAHEGLRMNEQPAVRPSLAALKQLFGGTLMTVTFDIAPKGAGAAYSASVRPESDAVLRACGLAAVVDATPGAEKVTYTPASTGQESVTAYYYQDGTLFKLTGCRGNINGNFETGKQGLISVTLTGHVSTPTDAALPAPTLDATVPQAIVGSAFSVGGFGAVINALSFDLGGKLSTPPDSSAADGFGEVTLTGRDVNGSMDPQAVSVATHPFIANLRGGTEMALNFGPIGAVQYNKYTIAMPKIYYRDVSPDDRDGIRAYSVPYGAVESTTDDEISIVFS